jgi:hypothetical protein
MAEHEYMGIVVAECGAAMDAVNAYINLLDGIAREAVIHAR